MTKQSEAAPHELVLVDPNPRSGATAVVMVPEPAPSSPVLGEPSPEPVESMTLEQRVRTIAGLACRGVAGVHALGDGAASDGVQVETGEHQTAIEISLVLDYEASAMAVSRTVRRKVIQAVEQGTGLAVTEVNVEVTDVHLPGGARPVGSLGGWPE